MFLFGVFSLTLVLVSQRPGVHAESNLSSKFQFSSAKEQNGKKSFCVGLCVLCCLGRYTKESEQSVLGKEESLLLFCFYRASGVGLLVELLGDF